MSRLIRYFVILCLLATAPYAVAQEEETNTSADSIVEAVEITSGDINGTWITQAGNLVEVMVDGMEVSLRFPAFARTMTASYNGAVLVYLTHYRDPEREECYIDVPESEFNACKGFIHTGDPRHRFTLALSEDGMVLSGIKEINALQCEWDIDESGESCNHRPVGFEWQYFCDYQWRRAQCDFQGLPSLTGNALERYELIEIMLDNFGLAAEFSLGELDVRQRIRFVYQQAYLDADTGIFVPADEVSEHPHKEHLDGRVLLDEAADVYVIEVYPYAFGSYVTLLSGLTILCHQLHALESLDERLSQPTTRMEIESVGYAWSHRQALCALGDEEFEHHIDFLSRALEYRRMAED